MTLKIALLKAAWEQCRVLLYFISCLVLLAVGLFAYQSSVVTPESEKLQIRQAELQKQLRRRDAELAQNNIPISTVERLEKDLNRFEALIPDKKKFADFIGDLFAWAGQTDLDIRQISYQPKVDPESKFLVYGLNFSVHGTYGQVKKFLHLLEDSSRILIVDKVSLTGTREKDNSSIVNLQIKLTTFFREVAQ
ncbi:MAG: type 4a pilus biogenesis protein PilO [Deltaproteobacteria bacterium]|nr:type 4a pilus biogenesis protein PilO [Deltaproteobacteria bacterium]